MPHTAKNSTTQLGLDINFTSPLLSQDVSWGQLQGGTKIKKSSALFPRIESKSKSEGATVSDTPTASSTTPSSTTASSPAPAAAQGAAGQTAAQAAPVQITIEEFQKIQLKTARVLSAERVPKSEKLLKLQVSLGSEQRQIVAGIGKKYEPESLVGKTIIVVANLKPAKLMGIESQGMVLAAGDSEVRGLATILEEVDPGTKVK
jgi:methionyl-tRNA synthetase